ncbi:MAG: hypothetical protein ACYDEF_13320 [Methanosarcina sp.]
MKIFLAVILLIICITLEGEYKVGDCRSTSHTLTVLDNGVGIPENLDIEDLVLLGFS